jgi:hypothetical protein
VCVYHLYSVKEVEYSGYGGEWGGHCIQEDEIVHV